MLMLVQQYCFLVQENVAFSRKLHCLHRLLDKRLLNMIHPAEWRI
jgi:hypothetical protein